MKRLSEFTRLSSGSMFYKFIKIKTKEYDIQGLGDGSLRNKGSNRP